MGSNQLLCPYTTIMTQRKSECFTGYMFLLDVSHDYYIFRAEVLYTLEKEEEEEEYIYREASTDDTYVPYEDYYTK